MIGKTLLVKHYVDDIEEPFPNAKDQIRISKYTYEAKRMGGASTITATIYHAQPLDEEWKDNTFVRLNGEEYYITSIPSSKKDNTTCLFKHECTFVSRREILDNTLFFDAVSEDYDTQQKDIYRSNLTKFTFAGDIKEFIERINCSLSYCGLFTPKGPDLGYYVVLDKDYGTDEVKEISFDSQYITEVLQLINTEYELDYYWIGKVCHVGKVQYDLSTGGSFGDKYIVRYGSKDALISVSKENTNEKIIDMITGYGSSDNIPFYYPNDDEYGKAIFTAENINKSSVDIDLSKLMAWNNSDIYTMPYILCKANGNSANIGPSLSVNDCELRADKGIDVAVSKKSFSDNISHIVFTYKDSSFNVAEYTPSQKLISTYIKLQYAIKGRAKSVLSIDKCHFSCVLYIGGVANGGYYKNLLTWETGIVINTITISSDTEETFDLYDAWSNSHKYTFPINGDYTLNVEFSVNTLITNHSKKGIRVDWNSIYNETLKYVVSPVNFNVTYQYVPKFDTFFLCNSRQSSIEDSGIILSDIANENKAICSATFKNGEWQDSIWSGIDQALTIHVTGREYITPCQNLMPSVYRASLGKERFLFAKNETYKIPGTDNFYVFKNEYNKNYPHQGSVSFDDIKPTIKGIRNDIIQEDGYGQLFGEIADVAFDELDNDLKDANDNFIHQYFYIKLHRFSGEFGFDLFAHALESDNIKIEMTECHGCPACVFPVKTYWVSAENKCYNAVSTDGSGNLVKVKGKDSEDYILSKDDAQKDKLNQNSQEKEIWIAVQKETSTLGIVMPNSSGNFKPKKGDKFVITGIKPPKILTTAAESRLDEALVKNMSENNVDKFNYSVKFSRIFLAEHLDFASKLNENTKLTVEYNNERHDAFVSNYSVKVDDDILSEVEVELVNSLETNQSDIKQIIDSVKGETVRALTNISSTQNKGNGISLADISNLFLSKQSDDTAQGNMTFAKNITVKDTITTVRQIVSSWLRSYNYANGLSGWSAWLEDNGVSNIEVDKLTVRQTMTVLELLIEKIRSIGGQFCVSAANGRIKSVELAKSEYDIEFEQPTGYTDHDLIRCQTFSQGHLKSYWVEVNAVSSDGTRALVSISEFGADAVPEVGDETVLMGNTQDEERQNIILISATEDGKPRIDVLGNVKEKSLSNSLRVRLGKLDGITDSYFPSDNQPHGDGLYADNAYLRGTFILSTGEDVKTMFEVTEGKINSAVEGFRSDYINHSFLTNAAFTNGLYCWDTKNKATLSTIGNDYILNNDVMLGSKAAISDIVTENGRTCVRLRSNYITQRCVNMSNLPTLKKDSEGNIIPVPIYLTFLYKCKTRGVLLTVMDNVDKSNSGTFDTFRYSTTITPTEDFQTMTINGMWNGTGDLRILFTGEILITMLMLTTNEGANTIEYKYKTLFEQNERVISATAAVYGENNQLLEQSGIMVKAEGAGIYTQDMNGNLATIGTYENGVVKLTGKEIQLEGDVTANGNFHVNQDGTITLTGYIKHSQILLTDDNIGNYAEYDDFLGGYVLDTKNNSSQYILALENKNLTLVFNGFRKDLVPLTSKKKYDIVGLVGNEVILYGRGSKTVGITGQTRRKGDSGNTSFSVDSSQVAILECCIGADSDGYEEVYWEYTVCKQI